MKKPQRFSDYQKQLEVGVTQNVSADTAAKIETHNESLIQLRESDNSVAAAGHVTSDDLDKMSAKDFEARQSKASQAAINGRLTVKRLHARKIDLLRLVIDDLGAALGEADQKRAAAESEATELCKMLGFTESSCPWPPSPPTRQANKIRHGHLIRAVPKVAEATNRRHDISNEINAVQASLRQTVECELEVDQSLVKLCQVNVG